MSYQVIEQFKAAMARRGLIPPADLIADGAMHRCDTTERNGKGDGSYLLHLDGIPAGGFENHQDGLEWEKWKSDVGREWTEAEKLAYRERMEATKRQREEDRAAMYAAAKGRAKKTFEKAGSAEYHPYLVAKGIGTHGTRCISYEEENWLIVPMYNRGELVNLQRISSDGKTKRPMKGAEKKGCSFYFGATENPQRIFVCEGWATAASVHECTGVFTVCAFDTEGLLPVGEMLRSDYPEAQIVFCADDDHISGNAGEKKAQAAALKIGGLVIIPKFGEVRRDEWTDYNDLMLCIGQEAVKAQIEGSLLSPDAHNNAISDLSGRSIAGGASVEWQAPIPIPEALLPVEPFSENLLPESLRAWVVDIADRMQCPPDFVAVGAMVAMSSVVGRKACIQPKQNDNWRVIPNLWGAIVGRPGVMKSPALSEAIRPLDRLSAKANDDFNAAIADHRVNQQVAELARKKAEQDAAKLIKNSDLDGARRLLSSADVECEKPVLRRYKVNDSSVEKLGEILIDNPFGTLVYRDELSGLLRSMDKEGQEGARSFYLQGYDGNQEYTFDRIMRGANLRIPAVCISMLGGIQPAKLRSYLRDAVNGGTGDDGLLQRFGMIVQPDITGEWVDVDRYPDTPAQQEANAVFDRLDALIPVLDAETGETEPKVYRFSVEAQAMFRRYRHEFEAGLRSGDNHPALESHFAKYRKLIPAIALLCALADGEAEVSVNSLIRALAWGEYLQSHAERIYASATRPATEGAKALLAKIKSGHVIDCFKPSDVYLKGWANLSSTEEVHAAIGMLSDLNYLRKVEGTTGPTGGRPSTTFRINPALLDSD